MDWNKQPMKTMSAMLLLHIPVKETITINLPVVQPASSYNKLFSSSQMQINF